MIDTVLFDMGGTLEDIYVDDASKEASAREVLRILREKGIPVSMDVPEAVQELAEGWDRYAAYRGPTNRELKPEEIWGNYILNGRFGLDFETVKPFAEELAHMWEVTYYHRSLRPGVKEMLDGLKSLGMKLGVVSNTASMYQVFWILKEYGIRDYFQDVTLSSVTELRKPDPTIFQVALHQLKSAPAECVYVGDTVSRDIIGSKRAGFAKAIQIGSQLTREKDCGVRREYEPDYVVTDIYEVLPIVKELVASGK